MAEMKEDRMLGVRGEAKPLRRMAIFREGSMLPIARTWGDDRRRKVKEG